jgi:hypothetical protein
MCDCEVELRWNGWRKAESRVSSIEAKMGSVFAVFETQVFVGVSGEGQVLQTVGIRQ